MNFFNLIVQGDASVQPNSQKKVLGAWESSSFSHIKEVSVSVFKHTFEEGMLRFYDAYSKMERYFGRVYKDLTEWVWSMFFPLKKGNLQENAIQIVRSGIRALQAIKLSDPIPEEIGKAVVQGYPLFSLTDSLYRSALLASGGHSLYTSMVVCELFHGQIPYIVSTFTGKPLNIDHSLSCSSHPETDKFCIQMGVATLGWFAVKTVSLVTSRQMPIVVVRTAVIFVGTSPHFQKMVLQTETGKAVQAWTHQVSDQTFEIAKIPVKYGIKQSLIEMKKLWRTPYVQQKIKESDLPYIQEIQMMFSDGIPTRNQQASSFVSWWTQKVVKPVVMSKIEIETEEMIDRASGAFVKKAWHVAKYAASKQCLIWTLQKTVTRNRFLAATMIVAEGGHKQTVQTFATRFFAACVFYYTSSKLVGPLMYGFFGAQIFFDLRSEYYHDNALIITTQLQSEKTEEEIQEELSNWWSQEDPLRKVAKLCWMIFVEAAKIMPEIVGNALSSLSTRSSETPNYPLLLEPPSENSLSKDQYPMSYLESDHFGIESNKGNKTIITFPGGQLHLHPHLDPPIPTLPQILIRQEE